MSEQAKFAIFKTCKLQNNDLILRSFIGSIYMLLLSIFLDYKRVFSFMKKQFNGGKCPTRHLMALPLIDTLQE